MSKVFQHVSTVEIDGEPLGSFDTFAGGNVSAENTKYRPGGQTSRTVIGGTPDVDDVTVGRVYVIERDHALLQRLERLVGTARVTVTRTPTGADGNVVLGERPKVYRGVLASVSPGDTDSDSDDLARFEITATIETVA